MSTQPFSFVDQLIVSADTALRTVFARPTNSTRAAPNVPESRQKDLSDAERIRAGRLMRVNHAGEIAAQALYNGQALTARKQALRQDLLRAADEENDHLIWCQQRIDELDGHASRLGPIWYAGSFAIGALAGLCGDKWSLGFIAETERQVEAHLENHIRRLPKEDNKSRAVLEQMKIEEAQHGHNATLAGGRELPLPVKMLMKVTAKIMTSTAYWI
ncbi:MAG: 2-polyprenyl-3-methyl-6-methoxy-1,4-benzoquinone monooxygenase [Gammaproteobacteria bacterium]|nr:2-polyprenyl-3-methyl-6-methoxy-1,4-benzoquinone monooxygenase [Gammaproteobacteria bacterium]